MSDQPAPGFVMQGPDRNVWVRAEHRAEWEARGFTVAEETGRAPAVEAERLPSRPQEPDAPEDLTKLNVVQLKERATAAGVAVTGSMKKADLVAALEAAAAAADDEEEQPDDDDEPAPAGSGWAMATTPDQA